jgi:hypothetical protein
MNITLKLMLVMTIISCSCFIHCQAFGTSVDTTEIEFIYWDDSTEISLISEFGEELVDSVQILHYIGVESYSYEKIDIAYKNIISGIPLGTSRESVISLLGKPTDVIETNDSMIETYTFFSGMTLLIHYKFDSVTDIKQI